MFFFLLTEPFTLGDFTVHTDVFQELIKEENGVWSHSRHLFSFHSLPLAIMKQICAIAQ